MIEQGQCEKCAALERENEALRKRLRETKERRQPQCLFP